MSSTTLLQLCVPDRSNLCAVIVTHNPEGSILENVKVLLAQIPTVLIVDNGSGPGTVALLSELSSLPGVCLQRNGSNIGLAAALNIGVAFARRSSFDWLATFDQDSRVQPDYLETMTTAYRYCAGKQNVAVISPTYKDTKTAVITAFARGSQDAPATEIVATRNSGSMFRLGLFEAIGQFRDDFFIDYIDIEFCFRCRANGFSIVESAATVVEHNLGNPTSHKLFGRTTTATNHSPARRYYSSRNRVLVYAAYFGHERSWVVKDIKHWIKQVAKIILFEDRVIQKILLTLLGVLHAASGRMGKWP